MKYPTLKFRAWSTKQKKFLVEGFHMIGETTLFDLLNQHRLEELDDLNITQYTTENDSNGKEIYVGDILRYEYPKIDSLTSPERKAQSSNYVLVRFTNPSEDNHPGYRLVDLYGQRGKYEVVGNMFENPELVEFTEYKNGTYKHPKE